MFNSRRSPSPSTLPLTNSPPSPKSSGRGLGFLGRRNVLLFLGTAAATGILFHVLFWGIDGPRQVPVLKDWIPPPRVSIVYEPCQAEDRNEPPHTKSRPAAAPIPIQTEAPSPPAQYEDESEMSLEELRTMVSKTKGYYGRDVSLGLGWNNVRYILEAAIEAATLLNRTAVIPSFVYARACEWEISACAAFAPMINRNDAIGLSEWRHLPIEKQMGWRVPMSLMLDLNLLRKSYNVITVGEYLRLHDINPNREWSNGAWHRTEYIAQKADGSEMTMHVIPNSDYDPPSVVRVDYKKPLLENGEVSSAGESGEMSQKLRKAMTDKSQNFLDWIDAKLALADYRKTDGQEEMTRLLAESGWVIVHTYAGALGMDYTKTVVDPIVQVVPLSSVKGWVDDYDHITDDILVLEGETHLGRKPGGLRFTTEDARDDFARLVLYSMHPNPRVGRLADTVAERMRQRVGGRMWMSGHMRRGDFINTGWVMESTIEAHFERIKQRLGNGRETLKRIHTEQKVKTFRIPEATPDLTQLTLEPPEEGDPFYLATDERSPAGLRYIAEHGAVLIGDLLEVEDRQEFGYAIMLTDVLAIVEQAVMSRSYFFYAHAMSSVAGGAVNYRAARGADRRASLVD